MIQFSIRRLAFLLLVTCIARNLQSQDTGGLSFFNADEVLEIIIKTDFKKLINEKKERKYQPAELIINDKSYAIRIKARGHYRLDNCNFPPIMLNFSKTEFNDKSATRLKKLKLVNACKTQSSYSQYVLKEYLIYRAFNLMTDKSFKVRLLKIEYIDTSKKGKTTTQHGFLIEDQHIMADRLGGILIKRTGLRDQVTNTDHMIMLSIFQFMMGNTDWQVAGLQNVKILKLNDLSEPAPYVIPYDFDYTGMVNATYAIPAPVFGIGDIRERLYWGKCYSEDELLIAIQKFQDKKDDIYQLYQHFTLFDKASFNQSIHYLDSFYKILDKEKQWKYYFIDKCRD